MMSESSKFELKNPYINLLIILIPFSIILGNLILNLLIFTIIISGFIIIREKIFEIIKSNKKSTIIVFFLILTNIFFSSDQILTSKALLGFVRYVLLSIILYLFFKLNHNSFKYFCLSVLASIIVLIISLNIEILYYILNDIRFDRISGIFFDEKVAGSYISKLFIFVLIYLYIYKKKIFNNKLYLFSLLIIFFLSIILTGDRSPFIITGFVILIYILFEPNIKYIQKFYYIILVIIFFSILYYSSSLTRTKIQYTFDQLGIEPVAKLLYNLNQNINDNDDVTSYEEYKILSEGNIKRNFIQSKWGAHFITALEIGKKNIFFGSGVKTFRNECKKDKYFNKKYYSKNTGFQCATHPHNIYFEIFSETGSVGLLSFIFLIFLIFKKILSLKNIDIKILLILFMFILYFPIQTTGAFFSTFNGIFYFLSFSLFLFIADKYTKNEKVS